jgi:hypothetical protein
MSILRNAMLGAMAGAAGTTVLDVVSYVDMAIRGRAPSELPVNTLRSIASRFGSELGKPPAELDERLRNRQSALAALLGYADGFASGAIFGIVRPATRNVSVFSAGVGLAVLTMLLSEGLATALGQTDPRKWGVSGWLADLIPRCAYGWTTCTAFDLMAPPSE